MASKSRGVISRFVSQNVAGSSNEDFTLPPSGSIPAGVIVRLDRIGCADVSNGDGISSEVMIAVSDDGGSSWDVLRRFSVNGSTFETVINRTWRSDGGLRFRIRLINNGVLPRRISVWVDGYRKVST